MGLIGFGNSIENDIVMVDVKHKPTFFLVRTFEGAFAKQKSIVHVLLSAKLYTRVLNVIFEFNSYWESGRIFFGYNLVFLREIIVLGEINNNARFIFFGSD